MIDVPNLRLGALHTGQAIGQSTYYNGFALDASGEKWGIIFRAPKTGSIDRLGFRTRGVTSSQTLKISLQGVVGSTGLPDGTIKASGNAYGTQASPAANTFYEVTLTSAASVTIGDLLAIVVEFDSTVGDLEISAGDMQTSSGTDWQFPYNVHYTTSWSKNTMQSRAIGSVRYSDTTYPFCGIMPFKDTDEMGFGSGSTPDEIGNRFKIPFKCRISGLYLFNYYREPHDIKIYNSGETVLGTTVGPDGIYAGTAAGQQIRLFSSPITIEKNEIHRVTLLPTSTDQVFSQWWEVANKNMLKMITNDIEMYKTQRTDGGGWTDTDTEVMVWDLIINGIEVGNGGVKVYFNDNFN